MNDKINSILEIIKPISTTIRTLQQEYNGRVYLVGGAVRDLALKRKIKDIDIEVHRINPKTLETELKRLGPVSLIGKQFGVFKVHGLEFDWSLPRKDSTGRKPNVLIDIKMSIEDACKRRDLTMNSMAIDLGKLVLENKLEIIDPFDGLEDIKLKQLRATDKELFCDDPLRFYRVMQFLARFDMQPDEELNELCKKIELGKDFLSPSRITEELKKMILHSTRPSLGFRWVEKIGRLKELFPELEATIGVLQIERYHPEGDVFEHTMQAVDAAAGLPTENDNPEEIFFYSDEEKLKVILGTLCHDFGKVFTTDVNKHAYGHEKVIEPAKHFLHRFEFGKQINKSVILFIKFHHRLHQVLESHNPELRTKKLAHELWPKANIKELVMVCLSDLRGRSSEGDSLPLTCPIPGVDKFIEIAKRLDVWTKPEPALISGKDLKGYVEPGPEMGEMLERAYEIQITQNIKDKKKLIELTVAGSIQSH